MTREQENESPVEWVEYSGERDMDCFWREIRPRREPLQLRWFLPTVLLLVIASVPWYLPAGTVGRIVLGLPVWIWTALLCALGVGAVTSYVALCAWRDDDSERSD